MPNAQDIRYGSSSPESSAGTKAEGRMAWILTQDGSVETQSGKVIFFSTERFVRDIGMGECCFICGAHPIAKPFNNEHILPEWVLRRFNLFKRTITLPNGMAHRYDQYTVPCCADCNSTMGETIEKPISEIISAGPDAVQHYVAKNGALKFIVWMGLIFLKAHLKDKYLRVHLDRRQPDDKIADSYDWVHLHHLHCLVRCFYNDATIEKEVAGSFLGLSAKSESSDEMFDFGDLYAAQTMMLRLGDVGLITVFNDSCGATNGMMPKLNRIDGQVSELQLREIMADMAFVNLSIKERPQYFSTWDRDKEEITLRAKLPDQFQLVENLDYRLRGVLLRQAIQHAIPSLKFKDITDREFQAALTDGRFTFLFDKDGKFIKNSFEALPT